MELFLTRLNSDHPITAITRSPDYLTYFAARTSNRGRTLPLYHGMES
jgi:hypothetical protein